MPNGQQQRRRQNAGNLEQPLYARVPTPDMPIAGSTVGGRDPRGFGLAYDPTYQRDQAQLQDIRDALAAGVVPFDEVIRMLEAHNLPPQLVQGMHVRQIAAAGANNAVDLVPKNPNRLSLVVSNFLQVAPGVCFSFDKPAVVSIVAGVQIGAGIPIDARSTYIESNGSVSINGVYVFCNDMTAVFPVPVLAYEGTLSVAGNRR